MRRQASYSRQVGAGPGASPSGGGISKQLSNAGLKVMMNSDAASTPTSQGGFFPGNDVH